MGAPEKVGEWQGHCRRFFLAAAWIGESLEADDGAWAGVGTVKTEEDAIVELEASVFGGDWMWRESVFCSAESFQPPSVPFDLNGLIVW